MNSERIWYEDLGGFITNQNYFHILPVQAMTMEEKLNALLRFFLFLGVLLALLRARSTYLFFGIIAAVMSILLYEFERTQRRKAEKFLAGKELDIVDNQVCARSTQHNPFMNPSLVDLTYHPERPPACNAENEAVKFVINQNFDANYFKDVGDLYDKFASQRQFYTVPSTTIPNDQTGFAKWCFGKGPTCKEGNGEQCLANMIEPVQSPAAPGCWHRGTQGTQK
jgi:hypothetical protein